MLLWTFNLDFFKGPNNNIYWFNDTSCLLMNMYNMI